MTVKQIVIEYLKSHGYDGLCNPYAGCGCNVEDICPCSECMEDCEPARKHIIVEDDEYNTGEWDVGDVIYLQKDWG